MRSKSKNQSVVLNRRKVLVAIGMITLGIAIVIGVVFLLLNFDSLNDVFATADAVTTVVNEGETTSVKLESEAELIVPAGAIPGGTTVTFQEVAEKNWPDLSEAGIEVKGIFQIEADAWSPSMESELIIPFNPDKFTQDQIDNAYLAYFNNGYWIEIPSTVDVENGVISAAVNHFSDFCFCIRPFWNKKPTVEIYATPGAVIASEDENLERDFSGDKVVLDVYTSDPDGDPVYLYYEISLHTLGGY